LRLVIMVKAATAGRVKTRLARGIGSSHATSFYRHTVAAVIQRLGGDRRWTTTLAVDPDRARAARLWSRHVGRRGQGRGDLGQRMQRIMDWPVRGPILIVGSDIPGIRPAHIAAAFRLVRGHAAVFGPTPDGGYWLVGFNRSLTVPRAFDTVRWSGPYARSDTLDRLGGLSVALTAELDDVDTAEDLGRQRQLVGRRVLPSARV
jgi:rSAM/selenodomain-associated transferase 1